MYGSPCRKIAALACIALFWSISPNAQTKDLRFVEKKFQLSFFPGISTNGLESGMYFNKYSLNLTSGISAGNHYLEIGVLSNTHTQSSTGIQLAGLANIVGANTYANLSNFEEKQRIKAGDTPELKGIQFSGVLNFVRNDASGIQVTGGFNANMGNTSAFQLAGISNTVGISMYGIQLAGLYNEVVRNTTGVQISLLYNTSRGDLDGLQLGAVNRNRRMSGPNSLQNTSDIGFQVGLINVTRVNDGLQIGLINKTRSFRGMQIGLINFFQTSPYPGTQGKGFYGIPVGLLNIGSKGGHVRIYANEFFLTNAEYTTGNCYNCTKTESQMPLSKPYQVYYQNALIYGFNYRETGSGEFSWMAGYGLERMMYYKHSMSPHDPENKKYFIGYGMRFLHMNKAENFDQSLSLLTRAHGELGWRVSHLFYAFAGVSLNYYMSKVGTTERRYLIAEGNLKSTQYQLWPSYTFGIQI